MKPIQRRRGSNRGPERRDCIGGGIASSVSLSRSANGRGLITGHAAAFYKFGNPGTEFQLGLDIVERITPGCFDRAVRNDDVRGLFNHDEGCILGRTASGTMRLSVDAVGLRYEIDEPDTTVGRDLAELLRRRDVDGSSFSFVVLAERWTEEGSLLVRWLDDVRLIDVGPVAFPAYTGTSAFASNASQSAGTMDRSNSIATQHKAIQTRLRALEISERLYEVLRSAN